MLLDLIDHLTSEMTIYNTNFEDKKIKNLLKEYINDDWKKYITSNIDQSVFNKILIYKNHLYEIFLILWPSGEYTKIHNHSKSGCFLKLLKGNIKEQVYDNQLKFLYNIILNENDIGFLKDDIGYHCITNIGNEVAISLHIYSPPNFVTQYFTPIH